MADNFDSNPPKTLLFGEFPPYDEISVRYKPEVIDTLFEQEHGGKKLVDHVRENSKGKKSYKKNLELYYKLYAMQDREREEPANAENGVKSSTNLMFNENGEVWLAVKFEKEGMSSFGLAIRDGKITLSSADLSPEQFKELYHFLYMRGLASSLVIPENINENIKNGLGAVIAETKQEYDNLDKLNMIEAVGENNLGDLTDDEFRKWEEGALEESVKEIVSERKAEAKKKSAFGMQTVFDELEEFGDVQGEVKGLNWFHTKEKGGWHVWTAHNDLNINNIYSDYTTDKDGNVKPTFRYKIYSRYKDGKYQFGYAVPPGKKLEKDQAEVITKLSKKAGYNVINFHGVQDHDFYTIRKACAKELLVPTGVSLKPDGVLAMIQDGRGYHPQGREVAAFEKRLVEQVKTNAALAGREMNPSEKKLYEDVYVRSNLANFRPLYASALKDKLDGLSKAGAKTIDVVGAGTLIADFYEAYRDRVADGVSSKKQSTVPTLGDVLRSTVIGNDKGETVERPLMEESEIKKLKEIYGEDILNVSMPNLETEHMEKIYEIMLPKYQEFAQDLLDEAYMNGSVTDSPQKIAKQALGNIFGRLKDDVSTDFRSNVDLDNIKPLANHSIILPAISSIANPYYEPKPGVEEIRKNNIRERNKGLQNPNLPPPTNDR